MEAQFRLTLRVWAQNIDAETVIAHVGMTAIRKWSVGLARTAPNGLELPGINRETYCAFQIDVERNDLPAERIRKLAKEIAPLAPWFKNLRAEGGKAEVFVGFTKSAVSGEVFDLDCITELCQLSLDLAVDGFGVAVFAKEGAPA